LRITFLTNLTDYCNFLFRLIRWNSPQKNSLFFPWLPRRAIKFVEPLKLQMNACFLFQNSQQQRDCSM